MPKKKMWVSWEDGADLSHSRKSPGDFSPLTRDEDNSLGHVVLQPVDGDEDAVSEPETVYIYVDDSHVDQTLQDDTADLWAALLVLGVVVAIDRRADIARWWRENAQTPLKRAVHRLRRRRGRRSSRSSDLVIGEALVGDVHSSEEPQGNAGVPQAIEVYRSSMGSEEARERLIAALMAQRFANEQLSILRNARVVEAGDPSASVSALDAVTTDELEAGLRHLLTANPSLFESNQVTQIGTSLNTEVVVSVPSRRQEAEEEARGVVRRLKTPPRRRAR